MMMKYSFRYFMFCLMGVLLFTGSVQAAQRGERITFSVVLTDKGFQPDVLNVPAGKRIKIELTNQTDKVAELESFDMKFEKIASPGAKVSVFTGPLRAGNYSFFDDYSVNGVKGTLIAQEQ